MEAEVAHIDSSKIRGRLRQEHLPAVRGRDPRRPVHVEPHIPRRPGAARPYAGPSAHAPGRSQAHAAPRPPPQPPPSHEQRRRRTRRPACQPRPPRAAATHPAALVGARQALPHTVRPAPAAARRPLDIGEEERHRPGRKLGPHPSILSRPEPRHHPAAARTRLALAQGSRSTPPLPVQQAARARDWTGCSGSQQPRRLLAHDAGNWSRNWGRLGSRRRWAGCEPVTTAATSSRGRLRALNRVESCRVRGFEPVLRASRVVRRTSGVDYWEGRQSLRWSPPRTHSLEVSCQHRFSGLELSHDFSGARRVSLSRARRTEQ